MRSFLKYAFLFLVGGMIYYCMELLWRGHSHWTMVAVGGICFIVCGLVNELFTFDIPMWQQMLICSINITTVEFGTGCILNLLLKLNVWDYSNMPFNVLGQICLPFCILWFALSFVAITLDDYLRYWFFGEEKPHYIWR